MKTRGRVQTGTVYNGRGAQVMRNGRNRPATYGPRRPRQIIERATSTSAWSGSGTGFTVGLVSVTNPEGQAQSLVQCNATAGNNMFNIYTFPVARTLLGIPSLTVEIYIPFSTFALVTGSGRVMDFNLQDFGGTNSIAIQVKLKQGWNRVVLAKADFTTVGGTGNWDTTSFARIVFKHYGVASATTSATYRDLGFGGFTRPTLAIRFDDNGATIKSVAYPIMAPYGLIGTVATISDAINGNPYSGYVRLTSAEMIQLRDAGWGFANHTKSHQSGVLPTDSQANCFTEYNTCKAALDALGIAGGDIIVNPYGEFGTNMDAAADQLGAPCQYGTVWDNPILTSWVSTDAFLDNRQLPALYVIGNNVTSAAQVITTIDSWLLKGGPLVILYHHIRPGAVISNTAIETPVADFTTVIDYLATKRSQFDCVTLAQLYEMFRL